VIRRKRNSGSLLGRRENLQNLHLKKKAGGIWTAAAGFSPPAAAYASPLPVLLLIGVVNAFAPMFHALHAGVKIYTIKSASHDAAASPVERLAIDEAGIAWLRVHEVQSRHTYFCHEQGGNGIHPDTAEFWDRRLMYSQRRYTRACESLSRIKKLSKGIDFIQVNIAKLGSRQMDTVMGAT
jgi:hypothetical protein